MAYTYKYPRPMVTVDIAVIKQNTRELLLIKRKNDPFKGSWALPGGFVDKDEALIDAAKRELAEETGITGQELKQLAAFGDPGRDPRGHTISIVFYTLMANQQLTATAADDAADAQWYSLNHLPPLAFDHQKIINTLKKQL